MRAVVLSLALRVFVALSAACTPLPPHPPAPDDPTAYPPSSYATEAGSGTPCERACAHLAVLHCPEAQPTKSGVSCPAMCDRASKLEDLPTSCVAGATTLSAVRACGVRCAE